MAADAIVVEGVSKTYRRGRVRALNGLSISIRKGEIFGIIGPNGAGKTTLMSCLLGLLRPDAGNILIDGKRPDDLAVLRVTGYVPERLVCDRWMTGRQFLEYHHELGGRPAPGRRVAVEALLEKVGLDEKAADQGVKTYSRGMLQRLAFGQALAGEPEMLYLDEPTSGMDPTGAMMVRRMLGELRSRGATVVLNSHQLEQVERLSDRVAYVEKGSVAQIEALRAGETGRRALAVTFARAGAEPSEESLREAAATAGAELIELAGRDAKFSVKNEEGAVQLVAGLVKAGVPVLHVVPDAGRLERLFLGGNPR